MMDLADFRPTWVGLDRPLQNLRDEVRTHLDQELTSGAFVPKCDSWLCGWDEAFSHRLGSRGWVGMTIPPEYGGAGGTALQRYVVTEELLAAGAPVAAHWVSDRQTAPSLLRYGSEDQRRRYLPSIANGDYYFGIGLSEPDAGSDLASVRTEAVAVSGGWLLTGTKVWTSGAHHAHALCILARTSPVQPTRRHEGLTQFIVELPSPGIEVRPILLLSGEHHFNEVVLDHVFVPNDFLLGSVGDGWRQVTSELAFERSGPERWLSTLPLLESVLPRVRDSRQADSAHEVRLLGAAIARIWTMRQLSLSVAGALSAGEVPNVAAALVKDMGTRLEGDLINTSRLLTGVEPDPAATDGTLPRLLADALRQAPGFTLRGGTNEVLRGMIAKALGLR
jgi:acyl-CoA dehydrogenase